MVDVIEDIIFQIQADRLEELEKLNIKMFAASSIKEFIEAQQAIKDLLNIS